MLPRKYPFKPVKGFPDCPCLCTEIKARHEAFYLVQLERLNDLVSKCPQLCRYTLSGLYCDLSGPRWKRVRRLAGSVYAHELYFACFRKKGKPEGKLAEAICSCFGSVDAFWDETERMAGGSDTPGFIWLLLQENRTLVLQRTLLFNRPCEPDGCPILAVDLWEHAWLPQYASAREYVHALRSCPDWSYLEERYLRCRCRM